MEVYGEKDLTIEDPGEITTDRFGLEVASLTWKKELPDSNRTGFYRGNIPEVGDPHPYADHLKLVRRTIKWTPGIVLMPCHYEGVRTTTEPVYMFETGLSEEPIETHPRFNQFAGTASRPRNGAIFETDGRFVGFSGEIQWTLTTVPNWPWGGLTSYLNFSKAVWTATYYTPNELSGSALDALGSINRPPGNAPRVRSRNYLYMGFNQEKRGGAYQIKSQWMLSDVGGWIYAVYGYDDAVIL